jgi:TetR/AcrR family transcriptional regulator, regulator of cefoperazone and chloramphenicol sensitivity
MIERKTKKTSNDAKERLLQAAIKVFATYGFEGASTRMLVKEAGVNISAIPYYYESKEGLYEEVIRHIVMMAAHERLEIVSDISAALDLGDLSRERAREFLHQFMTSMSMFLLNEQTTPYIAQIVVREQMQPSSAFEILYEKMMGPAHQVMTRLVAFLSDLPEDDERAVLCTHSIMGQIVVFKTHDALIKRRLGAEYSRQKVIDIILQNTDAILATWRNQEKTL